MPPPTQGHPPSPIPLFGPVIGFFNLAGDAAEADLAADRAAFAPLFRGQLTSASTRPHCDVLFLYGAIDAEGRVVGSALSLLDLVKACSARFAVVASANDPKALTKASQGNSDWLANMVLTLDRKGASFPAFFRKLFQSMFAGTTFALAWVRLAPQVAGLQGDDMPATLALPNIANLVFEPDWFPNKVAPSPSEIESVAEEIIAQFSPGGLRASLAAVGVTFLGGRREERPESSLFAALGAALGHSVILSIRLGKYVPDVVSRGGKSLLLEAKGKDGRTYWFGDLINGLLFEKAIGRLAAWQVIETKLNSLGAPIPDLIPIVRNTAASIGDGDFGLLKLPDELTLREQPLASLRAHWPAVQRILEQRARPAAGWPIDIACAIVRALDTVETLSPSDAARVAMEAAIPMSKLPELPDVP